MKNNHESFLRKALRDQRGQSAVWVALSLTAALGLTGMSIDLGHAYVVRSQLQTTVNAAALSGASSGALYNTGTYSAASLATKYAGLNPVPGASAPVVTTPCLNVLMQGGTGCTNSGGNASGTSVANAVRVSETASVPMYFMQVFGVKTLNVGATATAVMASTEPWNVAIILDATQSMNTTDSYCTTSNTTAEQCAMNGIQVMLKGINPCYGSATCTSSSANSIFRVSFFTFPNVTTATAPYDYCSGSGTPASEPYTLPAIPGSTSTASYIPFGYKAGTGGTTFPVSTYQVLQHSADSTNIDANGFTSDYYSGGSLNPSSLLVKIIGNGSTNGCMKVPSNAFVTGTGSTQGGETYFAGAIYAAQTALQAEQAQVAALGINSHNAIIFVSDGQAGGYYGAFPQKISNPVNASGGSVTYGDSVTYYSSSSPTKNLLGTGSVGTYPDITDQCQQAIAAAQYAKSLGTRMYGVAYGSESSGCGSNLSGTDSTTLSISGTLNVPITNAKNLNPCTTIEDIASPVSSATGLWYFYTDGSSVKNGCSDTSHTSKNLSSIFGAISATFKNARLISNSAS